MAKSKFFAITGGTLSACALFFAIAMAPNGAAQTTTGSIYGTVTDSAGAILRGAAVTATNLDTNQNQSTRTNGDGAYVFPVVGPGAYKVTATMAGFSSMTQAGLRVAANQNVNASFEMRIASVASSITVQSDTALVDTRESQLSQTIDHRSIVNLPMIDLNAYDLVVLVPGVTNYTASSQVGNNTGTDFSTNGLRTNFNSFYLDGSYDTSFYRGGGNIIPAPDDLSEMRVITSNSDAEFGRYPGAVVNAITRSGSNSFHGDAYDYFRNEYLNARNYFTQPGAAVKYISNIFGAGLGGPIVRNRLFGFMSYQGTRVVQLASVNPSNVVVPSTLERQGNFSQTTSTAKPSTALCPAYQCPLDPATQNILKYVPPANLNLTTYKANGAPIYHPSEQSVENPIDADQGTARIDYQIDKAHHLAFTAFNSQGDGFSWGAGGNQLYSYSGDTSYAGQSNYVLSDNWIVSPYMVNTLTAVYARDKTILDNVYSTGSIASLGMSIPEGGVLWTQPLVAVTGFFSGGTGGSGPDNQSQLSSGLEDTFYWNKDKHEVKFGGSYIFNRYQETGPWLGSTKSTFNGSVSGNALADFIMGRAQTFQQNNGVFHRLHAWDPSLFAQDDWRVSRRFTADLGLRWEVYYPFSGQGDLGTFIPGVQSTRFPSAPKGLLTEGDPGVPPGVLKVSLRKFAPRVGFAWDVFGTGKTALHAAYGIFYSFSQETFIGNLEQEPFELAITLNDTTNFVNPYSGQALYPNGSPYPYSASSTHPIFLAGAGVSGMKPYTSAIPYVQEYNLSLEQQYGADWNTAISYVGNVGRHFYLARDQNAPIYSSTATEANAPQRRPYYSEGYASSIGMLDPSDNSSYNSLQLTVTHQLVHNLSFQAFYVWSKVFDNVSTDPSSATAFTLADQYDVAMDRGLSSEDVPQRFVASFVYQLPNIGKWEAIGKEILSGWRMGGIETLSSGSPFNVISNVDSNFDTIVAGDRPNVITNPRLVGLSKKEKIKGFFNAAAYIVPPPGQPYGNSPRNPLIGPGFVETNVSAFKSFDIHDNLQMSYRCDAYNLFNNTNLDNPNGTLGSATFGEITSAESPRQLQMELKIEF